MKLKINSMRSLHFCAGLVVLSTLSMAQPGLRLDSPATRSVVTIVHIKPEMLKEWLDLQKNEVVPALKKRGMTARTVYASAAFGPAFEYTIIQPLTNFAEFDSPDTQAEALGSAPGPRLAERLRRCISSANSFLRTVLPDLSNPGDNKNPPIVQLVRLRIAPGKMQEYETVFKAEALPALIKANSRVTVARRGLGTDGADLTSETPIQKFADLDAPPPLLSSLGREGTAKLMSKLNTLATVVENTILIRQADLSF
jgi:hypothetical protein